MTIQSFSEFWPVYLRAHSRRKTRILHATGSILALVFVALAVMVNPWYLLAAPLIGYSFAWYSHFFVEHNKPATFGHPLYSLAADYVMLWKMISGALDAELRAAGSDKQESTQ